LLIFKETKTARGQNSQSCQIQRKNHISHLLKCGSLFQPSYDLFSKISVLLFLFGPDAVPPTPSQLTMLVLQLAREKRNRNSISNAPLYHKTPSSQSKSDFVALLVIVLTHGFMLCEHEHTQESQPRTCYPRADFVANTA